MAYELTIKESVEDLFAIENIQSRADLKAWCGNMGFERLYFYIEIMAPEHWRRIQTPKDSTRYYSQKLLTGYKIYAT